MTTRLEAPSEPGNRRWTGVAAAGCALLLLCAMCGASLGAWRLLGQRPAAAASPSVEYILDASARMALPSIGGVGTRLSVARGVLAEVIRPASPALTAGLRVFGSGKLPDGCADTDLLVPLAPASQSKISSDLLAISTGARADAALAAAVVGALRDLAGTAGPHTLVVVTGGSDSCNAQAGQLIAAEAKQDGIDYELFVIGYQVAGDQGVAISGLVDGASNGHYIDTRSPADLIAVLKAIQQHVDNPRSITVANVLATVAALPSPTAVSTGATPPPTGTVATPTATLTPTPTSSATAAPASTMSPTPNLAPRVISFLARFDPVQRSTFYSVTVASEEAATSATAISYAWSNSNKCGVFTARNAPIAEWHHPDIPGSCPNEPVHPGIITVVISNQYGAIQCVYSGGSAPGNIAKCDAINP